MQAEKHLRGEEYFGCIPRVRADTVRNAVVSQGSGMAVVETARVSGLDGALSRSLGQWRKPMAQLIWAD